MARRGGLPAPLNGRIRRLPFCKSLLGAGEQTAVFAGTFISGRLRLCIRGARSTCRKNRYGSSRMGNERLRSGSGYLPALQRECACRPARRVCRKREEAVPSLPAVRSVRHALAEGLRVAVFRRVMRQNNIGRYGCCTAVIEHAHSGHPAVCGSGRHLFFPLCFRHAAVCG